MDYSCETRSASSDASAPRKAADTAAPPQAAAQPGKASTSKHKKPRGSRAGASVQRKRDAALLAQRTSVFTMPVEGETMYRAVSDRSLEEALEALNSVCAAEIESTPFEADPRLAPVPTTRLGAGRNRITTDWSNVPVLEAAVAQYDDWNTRLPALHKRFDILEWLIYVDTVTQARLSQLGIVEIAHFPNTRERVGGSTLLAANAVLPASVTLALECLRPVRQLSGGTLWFAPYAYGNGRKESKDKVDDQDSENDDEQKDDHHLEDIAMRDAQGALLQYPSISNIQLKAPTTYDDRTAASDTPQDPIEAVRIDICRIAELREKKRSGIVTPEEVVTAVGYPLLTKAYHLAKDRLPLPSSSLEVHDGTLFHESMRIAYTLLAMSHVLQTPLVKGFDPSTWTSTSSMPFSHIKKNGEVQVSPSHPFKMMFTPLLTYQTAKSVAGDMAKIGLDPVLYPGRIWAPRREIMLRYADALVRGRREFCDWLSAHYHANFPP